MSSLSSRLSLEVDGLLGRFFYSLANEAWRSEHPELRSYRWPAPPPPVPRPAASEPRAPSGPLLDADERQVIDALETLGGGGSLKEISRQTNQSTGWLRPRLKSLMDKGAVRRVGEKLRTRYERVGA